MKNFGALLAVVLSSLTVLAQETETRDLGNFSGVKAAEGVEVYLAKGEKEQVKIEVKGTQPSNVITEISGSYLKVHMRDGRYKNVDAKVYVTYVSIDKLSAISAGRIYCDDTIQARSMEISVSSAGSVEIVIDAGSVHASSSSAGDIELKGKARTFSAVAESAGEIDAYDLESEEVEAEAASAGSIKINVRESLQAKASSGGSVRYTGNPNRSNTNSTSGGSVKKSN